MSATTRKTTNAGDIELSAGKSAYSTRARSHVKGCGNRSSARQKLGATDLRLSSAFRNLQHKRTSASMVKWRAARCESSRYFSIETSKLQEFRTQRSAKHLRSVVVVALEMELKRR
eukprot:6190284-Pleurochrysis_carterae.AAC.1